MCKVTISAFQFMRKFSDKDKARTYIEQRRWNGTPTCPHCGESSKITVRGGKREGYFKCRSCRQEFTIRTGTVFERSHIDLDKWLFGIYQLMVSRKRISSLQLSKELGITQKSTWFMLHRLREACGDNLQAFRGTVEIDETYSGGAKRTNTEARNCEQGAARLGKCQLSECAKERTELLRLSL
uniref:Transposase n=1 Tax=Candidatus Kentrum sp. TC TaxID=2126339 RepID=A0A450ZCY9_9GAMM|nr:MAG: Transposase [Candidatus Kentron sp. TC]VFK51639.1 MAG: Transposase [Candidatus Kentron sp. TC]